MTNNEQLDTRSEVEHTGDAILDKSWKDHWQNHSDPVVQDRFQTALDFYTQAGLSEEKALDRMKGINFNREVSIETIKPDDVLKQYQTPENNSNGNVGNYFAPPSSNSSELGIQGESLSSQGRVPELFIADRECQALKSTAADIEDWKEGSGELYYGSGEQYFISDKGAFERFFEAPTSSNDSNFNSDTNFSPEPNNSPNTSSDGSLNAALNCSTKNDISSDLDTPQVDASTNDNIGGLDFTYEVDTSPNDDIGSDFNYQIDSSPSDELGSDFTHEVDTSPNDDIGSDFTYEVDVNPSDELGSGLADSTDSSTAVSVDVQGFEPSSLDKEDW